MLREKIVAAASDKMIVIADDTKKVAVLGAFDLPVEVNMFSHGATAAAIADALKATGQAVLKLRGGDTLLLPMVVTIFMIALWGDKRPRGIGASVAKCARPC